MPGSMDWRERERELMPWRIGPAGGHDEVLAKEKNWQPDVARTSFVPGIQNT